MTAPFPLSYYPRLDVTATDQDARVRSTVDAGPPKMRPRFTAATRTFSSSIGPMFGAERAVLLTFYRTTLSLGSLAFTWVDETGAAATCRFLAPPQWRCLAGHHARDFQVWEATVSVEILP